MNYSLEILPTALLQQYLQRFPEDMQQAFEQLKDAEISTDTFSFYTSVASVYSSKIEGEDIELDSYVKHKRFNVSFEPNYTRKIDDLYDAYTFAKANPVNQKNIEEVHKILAKHIVIKDQQGKIRTQNMYVTSEDGRIDYVAAEPSVVKEEMKKLYTDIDTLLQQDLSFEEAFFFASFIHLVFVKIHPWNDGNGRSARLIEKWFLAEKLGEKAWFIESEKYYYQQHNTYYKNLRVLGLEYPELDYSKALPFLLMLPQGTLAKSSSL